MSLATLLVQVRTAGANQLRNLAQGFRQVSRAGQQANAQLRRDFDQAVAALARARDAEMRARQSGNQSEMYRTMIAARQAARAVDDLADQLRQANRAAGSLAGRMGAVAAAAMAAGADLPARSKFMMGAIVGGVAALAPALGAALQGAIVAGLGMVGLGGAIVAAMKDADIRGAWTDLFKGIGADLKVFGKQLGPALIQSATSFRLAWGRAADYVRGLFGDLSTTIGPLTRGLLDMLREAAPGIKQAFAASVPVLKELAAMLPTLGKGIGDFFDSLSDSKAGALKGIRFLVLALAGSLMILGNTIEFLSNWFDFWTQAAEKVYSTLGKIPLLGKPFKDLAEIMAAINNPADAVNGDLRLMAGSTLAAAQASREAAAAMQELHNKMTLLISNTLNADQAMLAWAAAIRAVSESVKENGRNLDINTAKGHANVSAILAAVQAAEQKRQADIQLAGGENAAASAVAAANLKFQQQVAELGALLSRLGFTQAQIDALLGKYRAVAAAPDITKYIDVVIRTRGDTRALAASGNLAPGGKNIGYAAGTPSAPPGWAWVGERGPELINFRGGETVLNAQASRRAAMGGDSPAMSGPQAMQAELVAGPGGGGAVAEFLYRLIDSGALRLVVRQAGQRVGTVGVG